MPPFKDVGFMTTQRTTGVVPLRPQGLKVGLRRTAVVTGHNHQRVFPQTVPVNCGQHRTDGRISLHHKITVGIQTALADPVWRRLNRCVGRSKWHVEEERLPIFGCSCSGIDGGNRPCSQLR